ncbi:putative LRR receptor-like serine/threonine-protein kinase [Vitis vinifera]|uniref:Putative LRR receptor-like serine/threonine-protein kinase n=1 Tax=Vitis vinifera TaxID=29760 RepID=A0A438CXA7_VITVI|nr:putative LRR receptor-like serine/threonine-protein kinase [Vitis vinifera]
MNPLQNLKVLSFPMNNLTSSIPATIFSISSLLNISLSNNNLSGSLPMDMCYANPKLKELNLSSNHLSGKIPTGLGQCIKLQVISLAYNDFTGSIPNGIGEIPSNLSHCRELRVLSSSFNQFTGGIPQAIGVYLGSNGISGPIPAEIFNISSLQVIDFTNNSLSGSLPMGICKHLPNLQGLYLAQNHLSGQLPTTLSLCGELLFLSLSFNKFRGSIPREIGNLSKLEHIDLRSNSLVGSIPTSFGNLKALKFLNLGINFLTGTVPEAIFNISELQNLALVQNHLSGSLPSSIGTWLPDLEGLYIGANEFSGTIPMSISNMSKLTVLSLSDNSFTGYNPLKGTLPNSLGNLPIALESFTAYACQFRGTIPTGIGNLTNLIWLDLGANDLTGSIPTTLGRLQKLQRLHIAGNRIRGSIPNDLCHLKNLGYLGLSSNKLSGSTQVVLEIFCATELFLDSNALAFNIPTSLWSLRDLLVLNLSSNFLTGNLPPEVGNMKSITTLDLSKNLVSVGSTVTLVVFIVLWIRRRDNMEIPTPIDSWLLGTHEKISHQQLLYATNDFGEDNLIGKGSQGMVYKGVLSNGLNVAIKVFNLEFQGALRSFDSECEVMQGIRHRNLVRIITCCSNLDFKALVLEYMPNGSLEKWLYSHNYFLDLIQRLNIMIDVASALEYLHHDCSSLVVHCDLKPKSMQQTKTLGTIGYMAPEHGSAGIVSTKSDVYSYGILLMEVFARKKPMDEMFTGDLTLKTWVESLSNSVIQVVDAIY